MIKPKYFVPSAKLLKQDITEKQGRNISEIMYEVGFSNLSYFAKCFKSEFGVTPKEYQQKESKQSFRIPKDLQS